MSDPPVPDRDAPSFTQAVEAVLASLAPGDVVTYGEVAAEAGRPGAARAVGGVLARSGGVHPWWRVVAAGGRLAPGKEQEQARRLRAEGCQVVDGRVAGFGRAVGGSGRARGRTAAGAPVGSGRPRPTRQ